MTSRAFALRSSAESLSERLLRHCHRDVTRIGDLVERKGLASGEDVRSALASQRASGRRLGEELVALGVVSRWDLARLLAEQRARRLLAAVLIAVVGASTTVTGAALASDERADEVSASLRISFHKQAEFGFERHDTGSQGEAAGSDTEIEWRARADGGWEAAETFCFRNERVATLVSVREASAAPGGAMIDDRSVDTVAHAFASTTGGSCANGLGQVTTVDMVGDGSAPVGMVVTIDVRPQ